MRTSSITAAVCSLAAIGCAGMKENMREKECASDWSGRGFQAGPAGAAMDAEIARRARPPV